MLRSTGQGQTELLEHPTPLLIKSQMSQSGMKLEELKRSPRAAEMRRDLEEDKIFEHLEKGAKITRKTI